jgi:shikimate kinase
MPEGLARIPGVFLAGFMGSGKSTVGRMLADEMGWVFVDLDEAIEKKEGVPITQIFDERGEAEFRRLESEALLAQIKAAERGHPRVVAMGGGTFAQQANREMLAGLAVVIWLDAPEELLYARVLHESHRPLARDRAKFLALYEERQASYSQADFRVDASGDAAEVVQRIQELPLW